MKIICPVSREDKIKKACRKSLEKLSQLGYSVKIVESLDPGSVSDFVDLKEPDHLFVDSDIGPFDEYQINILRATRKEVVSGAYQKYCVNGELKENRSWWSGGNNSFVAGQWGNVTGLIGSCVVNYCVNLIQVDWCGAGFLYVKTEAIKKILEVSKMPLFYHETISDKKLTFGRGQTTVDLGFSLNCMKANIPIWLQCACTVNHIRR